MFETWLAAAEALQRAALEREEVRMRWRQAGHALHHELEAWRRSEFITDYTIREDQAYCALRVRLSVGDLHYELVLTSDEVRMDGERALMYLLRAAERQVQRMHAERRAPRRMQVTNDPVRPGELVFVDQGREPPRWLYEALEVRRRWLGGSDWAHLELTLEEVEQRRAVEALREHQRLEAEARARALFARVAGETVVKELELGKSVPVRGSAGGEYALLRKASYCVRRLKDGAELCAVVPGVPLWDHLLGIKLMVETDEPRFLRTANVSARGELMPGGIAWMPPPDYALRMQRQLDERLREEMEREPGLRQQRVLDEQLREEMRACLDLDDIGQTRWGR